MHMQKLYLLICGYELKRRGKLFNFDGINDVKSTQLSAELGATLSTAVF